MREISPYFINRTGPELGPDVYLHGKPVSQSGSLDLRDYWLKVRKHYRLIAACMAAAVLVVGIMVFSMRPLYTAQETLLIEREAPNVLDIRSVLSEPLSDGEYDYYKTQFELLRSHSLAAQVIRGQQLDHNPVFVSEKKGALSTVMDAARKALNPKPPLTSGHLSDDDLVDGVPDSLVQRYLSQLKIEPVVGTKLVHIDFSSPDPALAARVTRAHSRAYIRQGLALQGGANEEARKFLEEKLVELKDRLEKSEAALNAYRRDKGIISMDDKENTVIQRLDDLSKDLTSAQSDRIALESQEAIRKRGSDFLPAVIDNSLIQQLKQEVSREEGQYASIGSKFKPGYPALDEVHAQLTESRTRLQQEISAVVGGIESRYMAAKAKEESLQHAVDDQKRIALDQKDAGVQYAILNREVDTNRQLYDSVVKRAKETEVEADVKESNIYVIDQPEIPNQRSSPKRAEDLTLAGFLGLLLGIVLAFVLESLDNTLKNPEEVRRYLGLPSLAAVPNFASLGGKNLRGRASVAILANGKSGNLIGKGDAKLNGTAHNELLASNFKLLAAEFYRTIRSAILLSRAGEPPKVTMFTSALDSEGKTLTAVNTAIAFANMKHRVLVIDADLRRPRCHTLLSIQNRIGLTEVLTGQTPIEDAIFPTDIDNLFLLPCGATPPNPAELVGSAKMKQMLEAARESFDMVIVDTVPMLLVSDAMPLSTMVDGVVVVVNGPGTAKHLVAEACMRLHSVGAKILGIILNNVDVSSPDYYYSHYQSYGGYSHYQPNEGIDLKSA